MSHSPLIEGEALYLELGGRTILDGIDLSVDSGEIVSLIGPNGAGKTTLLKLLLGLVPLQGGRLQRRPGLRVGYMPQRLPLDPILPLDVSRLLTLTRPEPRAHQLEALTEVGIPDLLHNPVQNLSGGELQRVLLARALLQNPDLLVLDEPTQGVDFAGETELYGLIANIRDRHGCGVLMVSHDLHLVMAATDRVVCLNHHVCCAGTPDLVTQHPEYLALFGHRAAEHLALYTHRHDHHHDLSGDIVAAKRRQEEESP